MRHQLVGGRGVDSTVWVEQRTERPPTDPHVHAVGAGLLEPGEVVVEGDHHDAQTALNYANEVSLLTAWRFARHVARIDTDVLEALRQAGPPQHLPVALPGLTSHAVYVPVPGGLSLPQETGLFVGLDESDGQRRLILLIEIRLLGGVQLMPVSLALGTDIQTELRKLAAEPLAASPAAQLPQLHARLGLALQCALHLGNPSAVWRGPGHPRLLQPVPGLRGKPTLREAKALHIWNVT